MSVSIHASAREATRTELAEVKAGKFQSTPPRGRRPHSLAQGLGIGRVSIHASAREATMALISLARKTNVSIHASAREATDAR